MQRRLFTGFSTYDTEQTGRWRLYDTDLIIRDLMNHFKTQRGSRRMRPEWGCRIWEWLFDPLTPTLREEIIKEVIKIIESDPRVTIEDVARDVRVAEYANGIRIEIRAIDRSKNVVLTFAAEFDRRETERTQGTVN